MGDINKLWLLSVYYYFYERSRETILRARSGTKALSTLESMLIGLIAGTFFVCILYTRPELERFRNHSDQQSHLGHTDVSSRSNIKLRLSSASGREEVWLY